MKKVILVGLSVGIFGLFWFGYSKWFGDSEISNAQTTDVEYQKLLERDKNVPQEKVDKAFAEAKEIQDNILKVIAEKKPEFKFYRKYSSHLISDNPGRRGDTRDEIT